MYGNTQTLTALLFQSQHMIQTIVRKYFQKRHLYTIQLIQEINKDNPDLMIEFIYKPQP